MLEVLDRRALAQELGIGDDGEFRIGPRVADDALDLVAGADRHGRLGDDHGEAVEGCRDLAGRGMDVREVGMAVAAARRRADRDEHRVGLGDRALETGGEAQAPGADIGGDQIVEARLVDRHLAALERRDL